MTWINLDPSEAASKASAALVAVSMTATEGKGHFAPRLYLSIRPRLLPDLVWWTPGCTVSAGGATPPAPGAAPAAGKGFKMTDHIPQKMRV